MSTTQIILKLRHFGCSEDVAIFILAQSILETGKFTSRIYDINHNLFGMKCPSKRPTLVQKQSFGHGAYLSDYDSIVDYFLLLSYNRFTQKELQDLTLFKAHLREINYCPSPDYISRIEAIYKQLNSQNHE